MINLLHELAYLVGGAFLANAVPHGVSAMLGRPFQTPFATPSGIGLSSSRSNLFWGFANLIVAYLLLAQVGDFSWRNISQVGAAGLGMLLMGLFAARHFGRLHGGDLSGVDRQRSA